MKYRIAIGTRDGINITEHFGQCNRFLIVEISQEDDQVILSGERDTGCENRCGNHQDDRIREKIQVLKDCRIVLVKQIGGQSEKLLNHYGITALQYNGPIEDALKKIKKFYKKQKFAGEEQIYG